MFKQLRLSAWSTDIRNKMAVPLRVELWNGKRFDFSHEEPRVTILVPRAASLRYLLSPSLYSLGRAYVEGAIEVSGRARDMIAVVAALAGDARRRSWLPSAVGAAGHTRELDAEAIRYHYDVSNEFYRSWLDPAMVYSCAYFERGDETLAEAQHKKIDHILAKLDLRPGHTLLDIGCGWGALVIRAAQQRSARCVGITLSEQQAPHAQELVRREGLQRQVEIRMQDYRDVGGSFDRISSVGMFEHVGVQQLPAYFARVRALLTDDGLALNHGITTTSVDHAGAPHGAGDFIQQYVFPRGELAHVSTVLRSMQEGGLETLDVENMRRHYARTCAIWTDNFEAAASQIRQQVDERRFRIWHVYLAGCAHAFAQDWVSIYQVLCRKSGRAPTGIAWSRRYMYPPPPALSDTPSPTPGTATA